MGQRAVGLLARSGYTIDASTVLVGRVGSGTRGRTATDRTGAARLLNTRLECQDTVKIVVHGQTSNAAGGYIIEAAHVPEGGSLSDAAAYAVLGIVTCAPGVREALTLSGAEIRELCRTAPNPDLTGDVRVVAIRATAGTKTGQAEGNSVLVPVGTSTISIQHTPNR